jgi:polyhydroxyalkanoate synthesis regulator phasin
MAKKIQPIIKKLQCNRDTDINELKKEIDELKI